MAKKAMRNLAFAYRILPDGTNLKALQMDKIEQDFTLLGIVSMIDPLHEEVPSAMRAARRAHIKVSVVTGDNPTTAEAIARHAELADTPDDITIVVGDELHHLADSQILQLVTRGGAIFSRIAPEDKLRIVEIAKQSGRVVAVTGDGINDAPALKRADIGVAMGKTGTDVAKDAAEIVLLDDSFSTLVSAVEEGRLTYKNIRKAALCALYANASELLTVLIGLLCTAVFHIPIAISAIQILAIDVITQISPVTALGWDSAQGELMREQPRRLNDHIINARAVGSFILLGLLSAGLAYVNFLFFFERRGFSPVNIDRTSSFYYQATTLTFVSVAVCQFVNIMLVRSDEHERFFTHYIWSNKKLLIAFAISFFCIANISYNPWIQPYFRTGPLSIGDWLSVIVIAAIYFIVRLLQRHTRKHTRKAILALHAVKPDVLHRHFKLS
jgi:Ca2+-transporting ATPase